MLVKKLSRHGNSLALIIDKPILELLRIDEDTPLTVTTDGNALHVIPQNSAEARKKQFEALLAETNELYAGMLERLAH